MKKSIISVSILTCFISSAQAQMRNIPGFDDTSTSPTPSGAGLGGSMSGSTGSTIQVTPPTGDDGTREIGTQNNSSSNFDNSSQQRMEESTNQNLHVPRTDPNLPRTQPSGTGIGTGTNVEQ